MRLALPATLFSLLILATPASAQAYAYAAPHAVRTSFTPPPRAVRPAAAPLLAARVDVGITAAWPATAPDFSDYAAQEIEAGSVGLDLYVRWYAFDAHARTFAVEVAVDGQPYVAAATVAAERDAGHEYGVHLQGLAPGLYSVRVRETGESGGDIVATPVRIRVQ